MALRYIDPCGEYYTVNELVDLWNIVSPPGEDPLSGAGITILVGDGRCAGDCIKIVPTGAHTDGIHKTLDARSTWIVGFAFRATSPMNAPRQWLLRFMDTATPQVCLRLQVDGTLSIYRGGADFGDVFVTPTVGATLLGTSTYALKEDNWYFIEVKVVIDNAAGSYEVRVNGSNILSAAGVDTQFSANATANGINFCSGRGFAAPVLGDSFDDIYIADTQAAYENGFGGRLVDFAGDVQVSILRPNADGSLQDFTPQGTGAAHYDRINDTTPNETTNYLESDTVAEQEFNDHENMSTSLSVIGIQIMARCRKDLPGPRGFKIGMDEAAVQYLGATEHFPSAIDWIYFALPSDKNPATAAQWTPAEVNADEYGIEITT